MSDKKLTDKSFALELDSQDALAPFPQTSFTSRRWRQAGRLSLRPFAGLAAETMHASTSKRS